MVLAITVIAGLILLVLRIFAQMIVALKHAVTPAKIRDWSRDGNRVTLAADKFTTSPGEYSLWWNDRAGHARIGRILATDTPQGTVEREVVSHTGTAPTTPDKKAQWNGFVFTSPDEIGLPWSDVTIPTENGPAPA